jgi:hypothetical protein
MLAVRVRVGQQQSATNVRESEMPITLLECAEEAEK